MKRKSIVFILVFLLALSLSNPIALAAEGEGNLYVHATDVYFDNDGNLYVESILSNLGTAEIAGIIEAQLEVFDSSGEVVTAAYFDFSNDELGEKVIEPGHSLPWIFIVSKEYVAIPQADLTNWEVSFDAYFYNGQTVYSSGIHSFINNEALVTDVDPYISDGRTLVPMRAIFEQLGATVQYDGKNHVVTSVKGDITIVHKIGTNILEVNGESIEIDVSSELKDGRTMVPLRAISESFGGTVLYGKVGAAATISILID